MGAGSPGGGAGEGKWCGRGVVWGGVGWMGGGVWGEGSDTWAAERGTLTLLKILRECRGPRSTTCTWMVALPGDTPVTPRALARVMALPRGLLTHW
jgi:hypothetical protein